MNNVNLFYYLNPDHTYTPCDVNEWSDQFQNIDRHLADDIINGFRVSTIWLGIDHKYFGRAPLLFETMVFESSDTYADIYCDRYSTWKQAVKGHQKAIEWVKRGCKEDE